MTKRSIPRINLLPSDLRPKIDIPAETVMFGVSACFVTSVALASVSTHLTIRSRQRDLASILTEKTAIAEKLATLNNTNDLLRPGQGISLQDVINKKTYWVEMFKELTALIPKDVWLTNFTSAISEHERSITLKGEASSQEKVASFLRELERSTYFNNIIMKDSEQQDDISPNLYKFEFNIKVGDAPSTAVSAPKGGKT